MSIKYINYRWGFDGQLQEMEVNNGIVVSRNPISATTYSASDGIVDLRGHYLLPSFIDAHCHILPTGLDLHKLHLGNTSSREEVLELVHKRHTEQPEGWLLAVHYNQTRFSDGKHLTLHDLDKISSERPIFLEHVNGHAGVVNSAALRASNVGHSTPDPAGGSYRRGEDGQLDGVLLERAYEYVKSCAPRSTTLQMASAICAAGHKMVELGISCASDMSTGFFNLEQELEAYCLAAQMGCPIHMRLYLQWSQVFGPKAVSKERFSELLQMVEKEPNVRIDGIKIFADGGISSATAAIYGKYLTNPPARRQKGHPDRETDGQLIYSPEKLNQMVSTVHEAGYKVSIHSIGDYSTDLVFDALELTDEPSRHRVEHAMILSDSQIERMQKLNCYCAFQPEFLMKLGPAYRQQLGDKRASMLIRSRSVMDAGIRTSFNSDRPIVSGNPWDGIETASNRPEGYDPTENSTRSEAIMAYTAGGADVNGDKDVIGSLLPGMHAHFNLYLEDPLVCSHPTRVSLT